MAFAPALLKTRSCCRRQQEDHEVFAAAKPIRRIRNEPPRSMATHQPQNSRHNTSSVQIGDDDTATAGAPRDWASPIAVRGRVCTVFTIGRDCERSLQCCCLGHRSLCPACSGCAADASGQADRCLRVCSSTAVGRNLSEKDNSHKQAEQRIVGPKGTRLDSSGPEGSTRVLLIQC